VPVYFYFEEKIETVSAAVAETFQLPQANLSESPTRNQEVEQVSGEISHHHVEWVKL
jgi:hypothetical protein